MPSPVLTAPLVVNGNTCPPPPVAMMTTGALNWKNRPLRISMATTPRHLPSRCSRSSAKYSSYRLMDGNCKDVWNSVCKIWKPLLSAAYQVRFFFIPPNGRTATEPSSSRDQGQPQCSRRVNSMGACSTKCSTTSWSHNQSPPPTVSSKCISSVSSAPLTPAAPPSAAQV